MDFELHFCEYNRSNPEHDRIYRPEGGEDYLFLLFKTPMKVYMERQLQVTQENACILYAPGEFQHYKAVKKFRNSYLHFSCGENLGERFGVPVNRIFYPQNYAQIDACIRNIQEEYLTGGMFAREQEYLLTCQLMILAARGLDSTRLGTPEDRSLYDTFGKLRLEMLSQYEKQWTTEKLCAMANLEKSQFYAYYQKFFQSTPHADLIQVRLDKAKNLLTNEALPISQIAGMCGFSSISHFCRYFKQHCGCAPKEYHKSRAQTEEKEVSL